MPSTFSKANEEVSPMAEELMEKYHQDLISADVKIDFIFAVAGLDPQTEEPTGPAITHQGYRALGLTKIMSLKDRTMGRGDAEILLDGDVWPALSDDSKKALVDHELHHLEVKRNARGEFMFDDLERPKLQLRKHDWQAGFFHIIADRWGQSSQEILQLRNLVVNEPLYKTATSTSALAERLQKLAKDVGSNVTLSFPAGAESAFPEEAQ
jgi:hypothetical protein